MTGTGDPNKRLERRKKSSRGNVKKLFQDRDLSADQFDDDVDHFVLPGPNDLYTAELFSHFVQARAKYRWHSGDQGIWMIWNGKFWKADSGGEIDRMVTEFLSHLLTKASKSDQQNLLIKMADNMTSRYKRMRMLEMARSNIPLSSVPEDYDQNPTLFNGNNGVIDLTTGELLPHDPEYMMTMITHVDYDPKASSKLWTKCIDKWTNYDDELITFLQRSIGYSMVGTFREKHFWFLYGITDTAKTTFLQVFQKMFGYYGDTADIRMFLEKPKSTGVGPRPEVLNLRKLRFIIAEEAGQHSKYDVEFLKVLTGGSSVTASLKHDNTFHTFLPYVRVWIGSNWSPGADYIDQALWNRLLAVPFTNVIPKRKQDSKLVEKLTMKPENNKAILAWMVRGCLDWQKYGLEIPEVVAEQTRALREQNDDLLEFKEENLKITGDENDYVLCKRVYDVYVLWCAVQGVPPRFRKRNRSLYEQLLTLPGVHKSDKMELRDGKRGHFFYGLKLKPTAVSLLAKEIT